MMTQSSLERTRLPRATGTPRRRNARSDPATTAVRPWPRYFAILCALYVISVFFQEITISTLPMVDTPTNLMTMILVASFLLAGLPRARFWQGPSRFFAIYLLVGLVFEYVRAAADTERALWESLRPFAQYFVVVIVYFVVVNLARDARVRSWTMATFFVCGVGMALLSFVGGSALTGSVVVDRYGAERVGVLGINLNQQALMYNLAIIGGFLRIAQRWPSISRKDYAIAVGLALMTVALARTGSRSGIAMLALGVGLGTLFLLTRRKWSAAILVVPVAAFGFAFAALNTEVLSSRWSKTIESGDTGSRWELSIEGMAMARERPLVGWGPRYLESLGERVGRERIATHNLYLQILITFGILGFVPWLAGIIGTLACGWAHRGSHEGAVLFVLLASVLFVGLVGHFGYNKNFWLLLALVNGQPAAGAVWLARGGRAQANGFPGIRGLWPGPPAVRGVG